MTLELDTAAAAIVVDHPFVPRGEWFTRCGHVKRWEQTFTERAYIDRLVRCGLAEAAHASTTLNHEPEGTT